MATVVTALLVAGRGHAARVEEDLEGGAQVARAGLEVHAVRVAVEACKQSEGREGEGERGGEKWEEERKREKWSEVRKDQSRG